MQQARIVEGRFREGDQRDAFGSYLVALSHHSLLDRSGEERLGRQIQRAKEAAARLAKGGLDEAERRRLEQAVRAGEAAREEFVCANLRLVVSVARRFLATGMPLEDLVQEGNIGLLRAVERFDWRKGFRFSTYATWWIRDAIAKSVRTCAMAVSLPAETVIRLREVREVAESLEQRLGRRPTSRELAEAMRAPEESVEEILRLPLDTCSLHDAATADGRPLEEMVADPDAAEPMDEALDRMLKDEVTNLLEILGPREREVVARRYGFDGQEPTSLDDLAAAMGLSRGRIRQILAAAAAKLRHPSFRNRLHRQLLSA
jgi:RNA polymerase primary sigma factor